MIVERKTMRDLERENGGAGVFNFDLKSKGSLDSMTSPDKVSQCIINWKIRNGSKILFPR